MSEDSEKTIKMIIDHMAKNKFQFEEARDQLNHRVAQLTSEKASLRDELERSSQMIARQDEAIRRLQLESTMKWRVQERNDWKSLTGKLQTDRTKLQKANDTLQADIDGLRAEVMHEQQQQHQQQEQQQHAHGGRPSSPRGAACSLDLDCAMEAVASAQAAAHVECKVAAVSVGGGAGGGGNSVSSRSPYASPPMSPMGAGAGGAGFGRGGSGNAMGLANAELSAELARARKRIEVCEAERTDRECELLDLISALRLKLDYELKRKWERKRKQQKAQAGGWTDLGWLGEIVAPIPLEHHEVLAV